MGRLGDSAFDSMPADARGAVISSVIRDPAFYLPWIGLPVGFVALLLFVPHGPNRSGILAVFVLMAVVALETVCRRVFRRHVSNCLKKVRETRGAAV